MILRHSDLHKAYLSILFEYWKQFDIWMWRPAMSLWKDGQLKIVFMLMVMQIA